MCFQVKKPMYIRDCMEGLRLTEDRETVEVYLSSAQNLIECDPFSAKEVIRILIYLLMYDTFFSSPIFLIFAWANAPLCLVRFCYVKNIRLNIFKKIYLNCIYHSFRCLLNYVRFCYSWKILMLWKILLIVVMQAWFHLQ